MNISSVGKDIEIKAINDFDIGQILECGQCFHFQKLDENEYEIVAFGRYLRVSQKKDTLVLHNTTINDYENIWKSYFDFDTNYSDIKYKLAKLDPRLESVIQENQGIRILNQDFFETLISFIISQNKQIPHIKQLVYGISEKYGREIILSDGSKKYAFPNVEELSKVSEEELRLCKVGFRAPYIADAVKQVYMGRIKEDELRRMDVEECRRTLMSIKGVGEKVANCVMLFSLGKREAFPVDVWMKRIMEYMYFEKLVPKKVIEEFAYNKYGEYSGYAQQYLFFYGRKNGIGK